jgi:biopolymer transport protein ExbD
LVTVLDARSAFVRPAGWSEDGFAVDLSDNAAWTRPARVEERVFIRAEADVAYGDVIEVMNGLRRRGFTLISVVNEDLDKPASTSAG